MENFEIISRAVILNQGKILLCKSTDGSYLYLPGGHVEFGESAERALAREIKEEFGVGIRSSEFIGVAENIFVHDGQKRHEYNFVFLTITDTLEMSPVEKGLEADWVDFEAAEFLPKALALVLRTWQKNQKPFWISQSE